jgi:tetratricopeptide (TPR) repeat protein
MAILIEAFTVIVRKATLQAKYPGGVEALQRACPNNTGCGDEHLFRAGFMVADDARTFVARLAEAGLTPEKDGVSEDVAIVSQFTGPFKACPWLKLGKFREHVIAWLDGADVGDLIAPANWSQDRSIQYMSAADGKERLEFVRTDGSVDVYREKATGKELYVGRTEAAGDDGRKRHDAAYQQACKLIDGLILLDGRTSAKTDETQKQRLNEAIPLFEEVVKLNPANWAAMWLLGKTYQRLARYDLALPWFARAHRVNPDQADVAREAAIAAMEMDRPADAIDFCRRAIQVKPDDAGLQANLALALLFAGKPEEADTVVRDALRREPKDTITQNIQRIIAEVLADKRPCPHHIRDL